MISLLAEGGRHFLSTHDFRFWMRDTERGLGASWREARIAIETAEGSRGSTRMYELEVDQTTPGDARSSHVQVSGTQGDIPLPGGGSLLVPEGRNTGSLAESLQPKLAGGYGVGV